FGFQVESEPIDLVNIGVTATGAVSPLVLPNLENGTTSPPEEALLGHRELIFAEEVVLEVPIYERHKLLSGNVIDGPAVFEQLDTTCVVFPGWTAKVLKNGHIEMKFG
ncbi:MAG TPA: hypothetical protein VJ044_05480, partial [Candidatus Hodarchaeales archaeon]|nr:hypothetical protein [Candidatus Hodarchaeales archaeon]